MCVETNTMPFLQDHWQVVDWSGQERHGRAVPRRMASSSSSGAKVVVAGVLAATAVVGLGLLFLLTRPAPREGARGGAEAAPQLSLAKACSIFDRMTQMMQHVVVSLAGHEQKIRQTA